MADFAYSPNPASVKRFFSHVQSAGIPDKVTLKYLEKVGFKTKNDRYIITVLKALGFLDNNGAPTKTWQAYRNKAKARAVLAEAIRRTYDDLFRTYPDAHRKDAEALRNYFSAHTSVAERTLAAIVATFKALVDLADFEADAPDVPSPAEPEHVKEIRKRTRPILSASEHDPPSININIQLQLPATEDGEVYNKLFAALKKHLFS
jgi:hypothetical protein